MGYKLDTIDQGILFLLQQDARNTTAREMAEKLDVSASTIRNRIEQLEENEILKGYYPVIDYENANLPPRMIFVVSAPPAERSHTVEDLLDVRGVINIREMLISQQNIFVEAVVRDSSHISQITDQIHELGINIDRAEIMKQRRLQPLAFFGEALEPNDNNGI